MPQVDGIELLRYVRSHKELADLPVVSEWQQHAQATHSVPSASAPQAHTRPVRGHS